MLNMAKTVQMSDFISYAVSLLWVKLCYGILLRNMWRAEFQSCLLREAHRNSIFSLAISFLEESAMSCFIA